jgi:hypothetical protein
LKQRRKAQEEADRIRREAEQREQARLAEEKRKADEQARREADVKHRKAVGVKSSRLFWPIPALPGIRLSRCSPRLKTAAFLIPVSVTEALMNIKCECTDMRTSVGPHNTLTVELEDVVLSGTVNSREVLMQLDWDVVIECLAEHGYVITHREKAA